MSVGKGMGEKGKNESYVIYGKEMEGEVVWSCSLHINLLSLLIKLGISCGCGFVVSWVHICDLRVCWIWFRKSVFWKLDLLLCLSLSHLLAWKLIVPL